MTQKAKKSIEKTRRCVNINLQNNSSESSSGETPDLIKCTAMASTKMRFHFFLILIFNCFCLGQSAENVIWSGESGGFSIRWTNQDISAHSAKKPDEFLFSTRVIAEQTSKEWFEEQKEFEDPEDEGFNSEKNCEFGSNYRLFSVVESILTFEYSESAVCSFAAHPDVQVRWISFDLTKRNEVTFSTSEVDPAKRGNEVLLTDIFPEKEILNALLQNKLIVKELMERKAAMPQRLSELQTSLSEPFDNFIETENCRYSLPSDFLSRFVFYDVEANNVILRIALPSSIGACRSSQLMLTIRLNIPEQLKAALANAAVKKQGFLMKDLVKFEAAAQSDFNYEISAE